MKPKDLKTMRQGKGWTQVEAAVRLGMTPAYLNFLEHGKRRLTSSLVSKVARVYGLAPDFLPVSDSFVPVQTSDQQLTELLAQLEYPGFAYMTTRMHRKNPSELLLVALSQPKLDARVAAALPWLAWKYAKADSWLVENARKFNLQNRLGFVTTLAKRMAENKNDARAEVLSQLERTLDESRLVKEDYLPQPPRTESERDWLRANRTEDAAHWNVLTRMRPEHLAYAS
jgi:transcriptional regulator with XRE-family HTH domain